MRNYSLMTVAELIQRLIKDVVYDAHSVGISYSRSDAKTELVSRGAACFKDLTTYIEGIMHIPTMDLFKARENETYSLLALLGELTCEAELKSPYDRNIPYGKQSFAVWHDFCIQHTLVSS